MNNKPKDNKKSSIVPLALITAVVGGIGAAVLTDPKHKKIKEDVKNVADDMIERLDVFLAKYDNQKDAESSPISETSEILTGLFDELKRLHESAAEPEAKVSVVQKIENKVVEEVHQVEEKIEYASEDIAKHIEWLQKKGRSLAKRATLGQ